MCARQVISLFVMFFLCRLRQGALAALAPCLDDLRAALLKSGEAGAGSAGTGDKTDPQPDSGGGGGLAGSAAGSAASAAAAAVAERPAVLLGERLEVRVAPGAFVCFTEAGTGGAASRLKGPPLGLPANFKVGRTILCIES